MLHATSYDKAVAAGGDIPNSYDELFDPEQ
jgi:hypothetical protein